MKLSRCLLLLCAGLFAAPALPSLARANGAGAELFILLPISSTKGTVWSVKESAKEPGDPNGSSPSSNGCSPEHPSSRSSGGPPMAAPRKLHIPMQARNEAAAWLGTRGTPPLLLRVTLQAYREQRCAEAPSACTLSDAELVADLLLRTEQLSR